MYAPNHLRSEPPRRRLESLRGLDSRKPPRKIAIGCAADKEFCLGFSAIRSSREASGA